MVSRNAILAGLITVIALGVLYMLDPTLFGLLRREGFEDVTVGTGAGSSTGEMAGQNDVNGKAQKEAVMGNPNVAGAQDNTSPMMPKSIARGVILETCKRGPEVRTAERIASAISGGRLSRSIKK
jgi:hypothetical protein